MVSGLSAHRREVLVTSVLDAQPQAVVELPGPSVWPFLTSLAIATGFIGVIVDPWWFVAGFFASFLTIVGWLWPRRPWREGGS